jgi:NADH dehydrogenase
MKILVTGASSFVGAHLCSLAARRRCDVIGLWRKTPLDLAGVRSLQGDITTLSLPSGVDAVVHVAAKVMADDAVEQNRRMLDAVLSWKKPVIYASSTVVHWPNQNQYAKSRLEDEARLKNSGIPFIILRPCAPYGPVHPEHRPAHRESMQTLAAMVTHLPIIPLIGDGSCLRQPVHVDDFNGALIALLHKGAWGGSFDAGGSEVLSLKEIILALAEHAGKKVRTVSVPLPIARRMLAALPGFHPDVASTFATDDTVDFRPLESASGITPRGFKEAAGCILWGPG